MKHARKIRALAGLGLLAGLTLFVVLPALASTPGAFVPPPSTQGITPVDINTGGQSNDCALFGSAGTYQFRISNPKTQSYTTTVNGSSVRFDVTLNPADAQHSAAYDNDKYLDFSATGAAVVDVGIKGGSDETRYNYNGQVQGAGPNLGSVTSDGAMHAPAQSTDANGVPTQLYSVSNLTFCFNLLTGSVSGTIYRDANQNGTNDTGDAAQSGWTVHLYKGTSLVGTTSSAADGTYSFTTVLDTSATYRVCEVPPSGTWAQTQPLPSSANICTAGGELPKGYSFSPSSATQVVTGKDFGNVPAVPCSQPMEYSPGGGIDYQVELAACKTGQTFVFSSGVNSAGNPYVGLWAGDESATQEANKQPMIEKITIPNTLNADGTFKYTKLNYTDSFPLDPNNTQSMPACLLDPRTGPASLTLAGAYTTDAAKSSILPGTATSCLIWSSAFVDSAGKLWLVAYVYSDIDGLRTST
jgi:SdrD B-like protein